MSEIPTADWTWLNAAADCFDSCRVGDTSPV
jgi:hypothetical protein